MDKNKFNLFFFLVLHILITNGLSAQEPPSLDWAYTLEQQGKHVSDDAYNIISIGTFSNTIDVDLTDNVYNLTHIGAGISLFIRKMDENKNLTWAKQISSVGFGFFMSYYTYIDQSGNIYISGSFSGTIDFDPGSGTHNLSSSGFNNKFILKLNQDGDFQWAKLLEVDLNRFQIDDQNNIYIAGNFSGIVDFDYGIQVFNLTTFPSSNSNSYIAKYDEDFNFEWAKQITSTTINSASQMEIDDFANLYITGLFNDSADFDPSTNSFLLHQDVSIVAPSYPNLYTCKIDSSGNFLWAKQIHSNLSTNIIPTSTTIDDQHNLYTIGKYNGIVMFNSDISFTLDSLDEGIGMFITKVNQFGDYQWTKFFNTIGFSNQIEPYQIVHKDDLYMTGLYRDTIDFDPGTEVENYTTDYNQWSSFVLKLDSDGNFLWNRSLSPAFGEVNPVNILKVYPNNEIRISGRFSGDLNTDPSDGEYLLSSVQLTRYMTQWNQCATRDIIQGFGCTSYTLPSGNMTYTSPGVYLDTLDNNSAGCDSFLVVHVTIGIDESVSVIGDTMISNQDGGTYQWLLCGTSPTPIPGETNQIFIPTENGTYAVEVTKFGCTEYSSCTEMTELGLNENAFEKQISYVNPVQDKLNIQLNQSFESIQMVIRNTLGNIIMKERFEDIEHIQSDFDVPVGLYYIDLINQKGDSFTLPIIKK